MALHGVLAPLLLLAFVLPASGATPLRDHPWLRVGQHLDALDGLDLAALAPSASRLAALAGENAGYVEELIGCTAHVSADGAIRERLTMVRRFLTTQGVEAGGNMGFFAVPAFDTVTIEQALVVNDDRIVALDPATLQVVPRNEPRIFTDARDVTVPMPGLRPGSTAVLSYELYSTPLEFLRPWSMGLLLRGAAPVERFEMVLTWDDGMATPTWASGDPAMGCVADGERRLVCRGSSPAFVLDADLDDFFDHVPQLIISEGKDWGTLVANVMAVVEREARRGDVRSVAAGLTAKARTPGEKLDGIYRFVADEVRYVGLEHGRGAIVPRPPEVTLHNRFGDCKDKVVLFLALARAAGLKAHAVLVGTYYHRLANLVLPSGGYFNHMIACVRGVGSDEVCVDPTLSNVATGELGAVLQGAVALDLLPDTAAPRQLPTARFAFDIAVDGTLAVGCDGSIKESLTRTYSSSSALTMRALLDGRPPSEQQRWLEDEFSRAYRPELRPTFAISGLDVPSPLVVRSNVTFPPGRALRETGGYEDGDVWLVTYGMSMQSRNRHYPFRHGGLRYTSTLHFDFCDEVTVNFLGAELDLRTGFGSLARRYERSDRRVTVQTTLEVPANIVPADQIPRFNRFLERALKQSGIWMGFHRDG